MIKLKDVYGHIGYAYWTSGKWIFEENMLKELNLTTTSLNIICVNDNKKIPIKNFIGF